MRNLSNALLYFAAALVLFTGSAHAQSGVEVYKSPT
jgi:predicted porin